MLDKQIFSDFKLWPINYIAFDILTSSTNYSSNYTREEKQNFIHYITTQSKSIEGDQDSIYNLFLKMYAGPVANYQL